MCIQERPYTSSVPEGCVHSQSRHIMYIWKIEIPSYIGQLYCVVDTRGLPVLSNLLPSFRMLTSNWIGPAMSSIMVAEWKTTQQPNFTRRWYFWKEDIRDKITLFRLLHYKQQGTQWVDWSKQKLIGFNYPHKWGGSLVYSTSKNSPADRKHWSALCWWKTIFQQACSLDQLPQTRTTKDGWKLGWSLLNQPNLDPRITSVRGMCGLPLLATFWNASCRHNGEVHL